MKILITMLLTFFVAGAAYAYTPPDSCLKMRCPDDYDVLTNTGTSNPDSVKVDSCFESLSFGKRFAKRYFEAKFTQYPFNTLIGTNELKRVSDLNDSIPGLKEQFEDLESELGIIYFKRFPLNDVPDSNWFIESGCVTIIFENYQDIEYILFKFPSELNSLKSLFISGRDGCEILSIKDNQEYVDNGGILSPNPVIDKIYFDFPEVSITEKIRIYTINGQKIYETGYQKVIDVSFLQAGSYFIIYNNSAYKFLKIK